MAMTLAQARPASASKLPGTRFPSRSSAGIPLMYRVPFSSLPRLNGKPAGRPGPELIRLIVMTDLSCYLHSRYLRDRRTQREIAPPGHHPSDPRPAADATTSRSALPGHRTARPRPHEAGTLPGRADARFCRDDRAGRFNLHGTTRLA